MLSAQEPHAAVGHGHVRPAAVETVEEETPFVRAVDLHGSHRCRQRYMRLRPDDSLADFVRIVVRRPTPPRARKRRRRWVRLRRAVELAMR